MTEMIPAWVDGRLTPVEKLEVHRRGLRHPAVSVFVMSGSRTLIQRRALGKYHSPGLWANSCCTHARWGEDPAACAGRRLHEELGITGLALHHAGQIEYRAAVGQDLVEHEVVEIFVARMSEAQAFIPEPSEVMDHEWVDLRALSWRITADPAAFTPWLRIYLAKGWGEVAQSLMNPENRAEQTG